MPIITLTSDLGEKDYYLAMIKAKILTQSSDAQIIDISNSISNFDITEAAYVLKAMLPSFPKGTIHLVGVGSQSVDDIMHLGIEYQGQYIITADNGLFSLLADKHADLVVELQMNLETNVLTFPMRDLYAPAAVFLANGGTLEVIGKRIEKTTERVMLKPVTGEDYIRGAIIYVDDFGNAISNIDDELIKSVGKGREYTIGFVQKGYEMTEIKQRYTDVPLGERLALINSAGHLEIAINQGHAANLLGLNKGETVMMAFG